MFVVSTNVSKDAVPAGLMPEMSQELAKAMGKPANVSWSLCSAIQARMDAPAFPGIHGLRIIIIDFFHLSHVLSNKFSH